MAVRSPHAPRTSALPLLLLFVLAQSLFGLNVHALTAAQWRSRTVYQVSPCSHTYQSFIHTQTRYDLFFSECGRQLESLEQRPGWVEHAFSVWMLGIVHLHSHGESKGHWPVGSPSGKGGGGGEGKTAAKLIDPSNSVSRFSLNYISPFTPTYLSL